MDNNRNEKNRITLGKSGKAVKLITFKESDFKKELAPAHAKLNKRIIDGETYIFMTYEY